jgi:hypothetical protein
MFNSTSHDFGVVARGAKAEYRFIVENIYEEDAHIESVSSSCGCAKVQIDKPLLKTWEKAEILVTVDTRAFLGRKDPVILVSFDLPFRAEVRLPVHVYIRSDIVVQPGEVQFGRVAQGAGGSLTLSVAYAGRDDWKIDKIECSNPSIEARAVETNRSPGQVAYDLTVTLKPNAPPGYIQDQVMLITNDVNARVSRVPVPVEGIVTETISVRPSPLSLGPVETGKSVTRNLVIRGRAPFHILGASSNDDRFLCKTSAELKAVHVVPITFFDKNANSPLGMLNAKFYFDTDLPGAKSVEAAVSVRVISPAAIP